MLSGEELAHWEGHAPRHWARLWGVPELHILARVGSTNDVARQLAEHGAPPGTVVIAEEQTAGRGRMGRRWSAPYGRALLVSFIVRPPPPRRSIRVPTTIPIRVGVAVARAIEAVTNLPIGLKWPNDVVVPGAGKVAGILCEGALGDAISEYVIAGVGVNVSQTEADLPEDVRGRATSLVGATGAPVSRADLASNLMREIAGFAASAGEPLDPTMIAEYTHRDLLRGCTVMVDEEVGGTAGGINPDGALVLSAEDGPRVIRSGTVRLVDEPRIHGAARAHRYPLGTIRGSVDALDDPDESV